MKDLVNDGFAQVVKPYIDREDEKDRALVAPVEKSPAEAAHAIGDEIVYNGLLYKVTAAIEIGDALATTGAGANIQAADPVTKQIKDLGDDIGNEKVDKDDIAPVEAAATASAAYAEGEEFYYNNVLYKATAAIALGDAITPGTNCAAADPIADQIKDNSDRIGEVTTKTLAANATSINFTVPTSGNHLIDFFSSDGSNYTAIDNSVAGTVTLTYEAAAASRSISCRIAKA